LIMNSALKSISFSFSWIVLLFVVSIAHGCNKDEPDDEPDDGLRAGLCGLKGERVECNYHTDCLENNPYGNYTCSIYGWCFHTHQHEYLCPGAPTGWECNKPPDTYCNGTECMPLCETHDDCENGICMCEEGMSICYRFYCREGTCDDGETPVKGTRICAPTEEILEGECHSYPPCEEGYERVGKRGCVRVDE